MPTSASSTDRRRETAFISSDSSAKGSAAERRRASGGDLSREVRLGERFRADRGEHGHCQRPCTAEYTHVGDEHLLEICYEYWSGRGVATRVQRSSIEAKRECIGTVMYKYLYDPRKVS
jgi:hypothetical protein